MIEALELVEASVANEGLVPVEKLALVGEMVGASPLIEMWGLVGEMVKAVEKMVDCY